MSSFVLSRSTLRLYQVYGLPQRGGVLAVCPKSQWSKICRKISREHVSLHYSSNCRFSQRLTLYTANRPVLATLPSTSVQKRFFSSSQLRSVNQSLVHNSSKTNRNSASISATSTGETREFPSSQTQLQQRFVYVQTSVDIWEDVPGGVLLDTAYLDSAPGEKINPAAPLVVSLHSTPGSFYDMQPVLDILIKSGCRVLAPSFPGHGETEGVTEGYDNIFTHTTSEKAEFVRDFLVTLGVQKADLLIGQGSGCYPAMRLTAGKDTSSMFKSVAFVSPWPHRHFKGTAQKNLLPMIHDMWERPFQRPVARFLSRFVPNTANAESLERVTMVRTLWNLDFSEIGGFGVSMDINNFPRLMVFAEDDPFVEAELLYEMADMIGISDDNVYHCTGQLERGKMEKFPSCLAFEKGGQHLQRTHPGVITIAMLNLLKSVRPGFISV